MVVKTETALDWWQRSQQRKVAAATPTDPESAAWAFLRGASGIAYVDTAWKTPSVSTELPVVVLEGGVGKTWTLMSLAARFAVHTRPSQFESGSFGKEPPRHPAIDDLPQVVVLDSKYDVTSVRLAHVVRSTLMRQFTSDRTNNANSHSLLDQEFKDCLRRIHIANVDSEDLLGWVPVLECLRCQLQQTSTTNNTTKPTPTLILWDGFFSERPKDESNQMEVTRQVCRLLESCPHVSLVLVNSGNSHSNNNSNSNSNNNNNSNSNSNSNSSHSTTPATHNHKSKPIDLPRQVHRIRLERRAGKDCFAVVHGAKIPFSLSLGGILS